MNLEQIRTAIRELPGFSLRDAADITYSVAARFSKEEAVADILLDCSLALEDAIANAEQDTRPADEGWKLRQDDALTQAYGMSAAFDALATLSIRP